MQEEETEAGYARQWRAGDRTLPAPGGEAWGPGKDWGRQFSWERKGEARGEAWDRQGPRGRFTR